MLTFYVPIDPETKYITAEPVTENADGLTTVSIVKDDKDTFLANWQYYYVEDGLPVTDNPHILDLAPHHLLHIAQGLQQSLINSNEDLDEANTIIMELQKASGQLGGTQAQATVDTTSLKRIAAQLGGQLAQIQVQLAAITKDDTTTKTE